MVSRALWEREIVGSSPTIQTMSYLLTTDTHFFHDKMMEYCGRPDGFESIIQSNFNKIKPDDVLIHLGDICIGRDLEAHEKFIQPLECKKWLIRGNHDKKSDSWYLRNGWDFIASSITLYKFGKTIVLSHQPVLDGDYDFNVHGHFHNNLSRLKSKKWVDDDEEERNKDNLSNLTDKHILLSIEETKYQPILLRNMIGQ